MLLPFLTGDRFFVGISGSLRGQHHKSAGMPKPNVKEDEKEISWSDLNDAIEYGRLESLDTFRRHQSDCGPDANADLVENVNDSTPTPRSDRHRRITVPQSVIPTIKRGNRHYSTTTWNDLEDEIARALRESLADQNKNHENASTASELIRTTCPKETAWNCVACTFFNENPQHLVCSVCGTAKAANPPLPPSLNGSFTSQSSGSQRVGSLASRTREKSSFTSQSSQQPNGLKAYQTSNQSLIRSHSSQLEASHVNPKVVKLPQSSRRKKPNHEPRENSSFTSQSSQQTNDLKSTQTSHPSSIISNASEMESRVSFDVVKEPLSYRQDFSSTLGMSGKIQMNHLRCSREEALGRDDSSQTSRSSKKSHQLKTVGESKSFNDNEPVGSDDGSVGNAESTNCFDFSDDDDRTIRTMATIKTLQVPEGKATIIYTDVQGSTSLWEAHPAAMKKATDLHDNIIRKCYAIHRGYEISTEGDSFNIAFQHPADAIGFALKAQLQLFKADWPEEILSHSDGRHNEKKGLRGFRVRMGMHHGSVHSTVHETTGRTMFHGDAVDVAKSIEKMSHGGQILTTVETWRAVGGMAEELLGKPQVMDCGEHILYDPKKKRKPIRVSKRIVQLVPNQLAYDFFAARGGQETKEGETPPRVCGRVFPPLESHGQLSTSFLNAPYVGNRVAIVFVYTDKLELININERRKNNKFLAKYIRSHLMQLSPPGYECQEDKGSWMLAFDRIENAITFGLELNETTAKSTILRGIIDQKRIFRIGIHWGAFLSMGPHTITGHADYFGPIVNRAARVAAQCEPGQVCVGVPMDDDEEPPDPGPTVEIEVLGVKQLKGISTEIVIFSCRKKSLFGMEPEKKEP